MSTATSGTSSADPEAIISKLVQSYRDSTGTPGVAVALYYQQRGSFFPFGYANKDTKQLVTEDMIFGIGSVTKVFTATLLASQLPCAGAPQPPERSKQLDDPVAKYLPSTVTNPQLQAVTLRTLATHTAGFPNEGGGPVSVQLFDDKPPSPTLISFWNNWSPSDPKNGPCYQCSVGTCWWYSSVGFVTLGFAVVGQPGPPDQPGYNQLLSSIITTPLNMPATFTHIPAGAPLAQGYRGTQITPVAQQAPDLKSSARDMLTWLEANLGLFNSSIPQSLSQAITCTHQTYFNSSQQCSHAPAIPFDMGLAWQIHPLQAGGPIVYGKDGATSQGGYSCWIGFIPSQQIGLAVLTNLFGVKGPQGEQNPTELGLDILKSLVALDETTAY